MNNVYCSSYRYDDATVYKGAHGCRLNLRNNNNNNNNVSTYGVVLD